MNFISPWPESLLHAFYVGSFKTKTSTAREVQLNADERLKLLASRIF